jgi:glycosyltransferase involved in cell wall biosynthesis
LSFAKQSIAFGYFGLKRSIQCSNAVSASFRVSAPQILCRLLRLYLVEERSPEQLAFAIRKLAENEQLRKDQGIKNREIVLTGYSVNNVKSYIDELESLVND